MEMQPGSATKSTFYTRQQIMYGKKITDTKSPSASRASYHKKTQKQTDKQIHK